VNDIVEREIVSDRGMGNARLVELRPGRPGPCIFLVPGLGGRVEGFSELATLLDTPMPLVAIEARGLDSKSDPDHDMETLVRHYVDRVRTVQPNGPYFLLGHSAGGAVVFEMAQRLLAMQERVRCLILLDTPLPKPYRSLRFYLANLRPRLRTHFERVMSDSVTQNISYYAGRLRRRWRRFRKIPPDLMSGPKAARVSVATSMMMGQWRPEFYPGRLTLFCFAETKLWTLYQNRAAELETHFLAGDHANMAEQPFVPSLARDLSACLAKASLTCI
jgi:thioesterase domain-containing protein